MSDFQPNTVAFKVRDYECDQQGIVNNAVYLHYLEHARHEYLEALGFNFKKFLDDGIYLMAVEMSIRYWQPLRSGEHFTVRSLPQYSSRLKIQFHQEIMNAQNEKMTTAHTTVVAIRDQKPIAIRTLFE